MADNTFENILSLGCKIDVCSVQQLQRNKVTGEKTPILASRLEDIKKDGTLIIAMPIYQGKIVLMSTGVRYELVFYSKKGLYRGIGQVTERYKEDNRFLVKLVLTTALNKFQRREYFRLQCILSMKAYKIKTEDALKYNDVQIEALTEQEEVGNTAVEAVIVDISGGGVRFIGPEEYKQGSYICIETTIANESTNMHVFLTACIIGSRRADGTNDKYETRAEFIHVDSRTRETIIKYIFDEDRKIRKKDMGI